MSKLPSIFILFLLLTFELQGQTCLPDHLTFTRQGQVDSFSILYPGCTDINGEFTLYSAAIKNLQGLSHIQTISGRFRVLSTDVTDFTEMVALEAITQIEILGNSKMESLNGIHVDSLDYLHLRTGIQTNLDALSTLKYVRVLTLELMPLQSLDAFSNLVDFEYFQLLDISNLTNLHGFPQVLPSSHNREVEIYRCKSLLSLQGIGNSSITTLYLSSNPLLTQISAADNLSGVKSLISLQNHGLTSIDAEQMNQLESISLVTNNSLASLQVSPALTRMGYISFLGNPNLFTVSGFENVRTLDGIYIQDMPWHDLGIFQSVDSIKHDLYFDKEFSLEDISSLEGLKYIGGSLTIHITRLTSLAGLDSLTYVGNNLSIQYNYEISSMTGLKSLAFIGGNLTLQGTQVQDLAGFEALHHIGGSLSIYYMSTLQSMNGLGSIDTIRNLYIYYNPLLKDIDALKDLKYVDGYFSLEENGSLSFLPDFEGLVSINGNLTITKNNQLVSVEGLQHLKNINDYHLIITDNALLPNLAGLDSIPWHKISKLIVKDNPSLSICATPTICQYLAQEVKLRTISNNAPGCQNSDEVIGSCGPLSTNKLLKEQVLIYPNPSTGVVQIDTDHAIQSIHVYDIQGTLAINADITMGSLDISSLAEGIYFIQLHLEDGIVIKKVVKY